MCATEDIAIRDFMSVWARQTKPAKIPPQQAQDIRISLKFIEILGILGKIRINPYPPSFNKTPAKIIEPATGASTCALGNQKWTRNIGNFTKNVIKPPYKIKTPSQDFIWKCCSILNLVLVLSILQNKIKRKRGTDAKIV